MAERLDVALVARGVSESRTKAQRRISQGDVWVNGICVTKTSHPVSTDDEIVLAGGSDDVGRGAVKLRAALTQWDCDVAGRQVLDIGASTGGFTEVLLTAGAAQVVALDVGHGQLHPRLREDPRFRALDGVNIKGVTPVWWESVGGGDIDFIVADVSFVSLTHVLPPVVALWGLVPWVVLVKPQFEVGRTHISGGIARDPLDHERALATVLRCAEGLGLECGGIIESPITGEAGNREYLCWLTPTTSENPPQWSERIHHLSRAGRNIQ